MSNIEVRAIEKLGSGTPGFEEGAGFFKHKVALPASPFKDYIGQHLAIVPPGFNPATDELIIVKKDARRVFVYGHGPEQTITIRCPEWLGHVRKWQAALSSNLKANLYGLKGHECLEFVAVETHCPPEPTPPHKPASVLISVPTDWAERVGTGDLSKWTGMPSSVIAECAAVVKPFQQ